MLVQKGRGGGLLREPGGAAGDDGGGRHGQRRADEVVGVAVPVHHLVVLVLEAADREALGGAAAPSRLSPGLGGGRSNEADVASAAPSATTPATGEFLSLIPSG